MSMEVQADYAYKVKAVEDRLVEPIHDRLIDADRLVRAQNWRYGFPVWAMYRAAYCGDNHSVRQVKEAAIAFAATFGEAGGIRSDARSDDLYGIAGMDAAYRMMYGHWMISEREGGALCGVHNATYDRFRTSVWRVMDAVLREYWGQLIASYISLAAAYRE